METLLKVLVPILVVTYMFGAGLAAPPESFRKVRAGAVVRGLVLMLVLGPIATGLIARLFISTPEVVVALVVLSTVGVMPLASRRTAALGGSVSTALVLTLALAVIAPFAAVPLVRWLLPYTGRGGHLIEPGFILLKSVIIQIFPLLFGLAVARTSARAAEIERVFRKVNVVVFTGVVLVLLVPLLDVLVKVGGKGAAGAVLCALVLAALALLVGGPGTADRRATLSIANAPNVGLALAIVNGARLGRSFIAMVLGVFVVRALTGAVIREIAGRRIGRAAPAHEAGRAA